MTPSTQHKDVTGKEENRDQTRALHCLTPRVAHVSHHSHLINGNSLLYVGLAWWAYDLCCHTGPMIWHVGHTLGLMPCCCHLKILRIKVAIFSFRAGPHKFIVGPACIPGKEGTIAHIKGSFYYPLISKFSNPMNFWVLITFLAHAWLKDFYSSVLLFLCYNMLPSI